MAGLGPTIHDLRCLYQRQAWIATLADQRDGVEAAECPAQAESPDADDEVTLQRVERSGRDFATGAQEGVDLRLGGKAEPVAQIGEGQATGAVLLKREGFQRFAAEVAGARAFETYENGKLEPSSAMTRLLLLATKRPGLFAKDSGVPMLSEVDARLIRDTVRKSSLDCTHATFGRRSTGILILGRPEHGFVQHAQDGDLVTVRKRGSGFDAVDDQIRLSRYAEFSCVRRSSRLSENRCSLRISTASRMRRSTFAAAAGFLA